MPYTIEVTEAAPQTIASTRIRTNRASIAADIGSGFGAVMEAMVKESAVATGAPLLVYHDVIDDTTDGDIEICVPVAGPLAGSGGVSTRELEGGTVATTIHRGPYPEIGAAYEATMAWIAEHGREMTGPPREIYLNDPQTVPPADLLTRVEFPIAP
ncbi:MAG: GyrI-like domain-containing protein [Acidimicrobiia bacterium]